MIKSVSKGNRAATKKAFISVILLTVGSFLVWAGVTATTFIREINSNFLLPLTSPSVILGREFSDSIEQHIASYGFVDFDQLADFEWNRMMIATPYQDPWQMLENHGIQCQRINTGIKFEDWQSLIIFLNNGRIAAYINLPRSVADFRGTIQSDQIFQRENSSFFVFSSESIWGWDGVHLAHWDKNAGDYFPLANERWQEIADTVRDDDEEHWVWVAPITDPREIARHELSRALFPFAPDSNITYVPPYEDGTLPPYIVVEIVSLSLYNAATPPDDFPQESIGNHNYSSGELLGFYTGTLQYTRSTYEYIGEDWWAVVSWWQGTLYNESEIFE